MVSSWNFFMNNYGASYYPSALTYDMCSGSLMGSMNIQWNQALEHSVASAGLYMVPQYNFNNFFQYASPLMSNAYLLDPMYTVAQMDWQNKVSGGMGIGSFNGQYSMPNMNAIWGWNPTGSTSTTTTAPVPAIFAAVFTPTRALPT